jgi:hypothetical protein
VNLTVQVERIEVINLRPGDLIIVTLPVESTPEQIAYIKAEFTNQFPDNRVLVRTSNVGLDFFGRDGELVR